jgi:hypothetical protein
LWEVVGSSREYDVWDSGYKVVCKVLFVGDSDSILDEEVDMGVAVVEEDSSYWVGTEVGCKHCMVGNCILWNSVGCIGVGVIVGK